MTPNWSRAEIPMMPKGRYKIMTAYMPKVGKLRPRHDVPHLHGADEPRLLLRSRHGEKAARRAGAAAGRDRAVRQLAVHRRQAQRLPVVPLGDLARHRQPARRHAAVGVRAGHGLRALRRLCARRADVFHQARRQLHRRVRQIVPRPSRRQARFPATRATISDWANHVSTIFPGGAAQALHRDARLRRRAVAPAAGAAGVLGRADLRRRQPRCLLGDGEGLDRRGAPEAAR